MALGTRVASLFAELKLDDQMTSGLTTARGGLDSFGTKLTGIGTKLTGLGTKMTLASAPIVAGLVVAIKKATEFETAMANAGAILGKTREEMSDLSDEILSLGGSARAGPQAVAEAYFDIVSGVADASLHMDIMTAAIATSEAGAADLGATTNALVGTLNAFKDAGLSASDASDIMTQTVAKGVLTMDEMAAALPQVTSLAASLGIPFAEIGAELAVLTQTGTTASVATTQLRGAMLALINPNETMKKAIEELGFANGQAAIDTLGFQGTLDALTETTVASEEGLAKVMGGAEGLQAAINLAGDDTAEFIERFQGIPTAAEEAAAELAVIAGEADDVKSALNEMGVGFEGATEAAREIQNASPAAQFDFLKSAAHELSIEIGGPLADGLAAIATSLTPIVQDITDWIGENPELVDQITKLVGGALLLGPLLIVIGLGFTAAGTAVGVLSVALGLLVSPIAQWIVVIGLFIFALNELAKKMGFDGIVDLVRETFETWAGIIDQTIGLVELAWDAFWTGVAGAFDDFKLIIQNVLNALIEAVNPVLEALGFGQINTIEWVINVVAVVSPEAQAFLDFGSGVSVGIGAGIIIADTIAGIEGNAMGGPVSAGVPTFVGEAGTELFVPSSAGRIVPNNQLGRGGGGGFQIFGPIIVQGVQDVGAMLDAIERESSMRAARSS